MLVSRHWQSKFSFSLFYESVEARFASRFKEEIFWALLNGYEISCGSSFSLLKVC
jgi:hypothetical protein